MPGVKMVREMAVKLGLKNFRGLKKADLIRAVQVAEGNSPCYQRITDCGQIDCLFWSDCQPRPRLN